MRLEYTVRRGDAARVAGAVQRYQVVRWQFWAPVVAAAVVLGTIGYSLRGAGAAVFGVVLIAIAVALTMAFQRRRLARALAARGFAPGSALATELDGDRITIMVAHAMSSHAASELLDIKVVNRIVLLRVREARFVLALPEELVPAASRAALGARP